MKGLRSVLHHLGDIFTSVNICESHAIHAVLLIALFSMLYSCNKKHNWQTEYSEKSYKEVFFDKTLATISALDSNQFYICTEDGSILLFDRSGTTRSLNTQIRFERIYEIMRDDADSSIVWVAARNKGLYKCSLSLEKSKLDTICSFTIPGSKVGSKYSVYNMTIHDNKLFVATSHGLYTLEDLKASTRCSLTKCWPLSPDSIETPIVVANVCSGKDNKLYFTSPGAIRMLRYPGAHESVIVKREENNDPLLYKTRQGIVLGVIGDSLYHVEDYPSRNAEFIGHRCIDFLQANGNRYEVTEDSIFVNGRGSRLPEQAISSCRNLMVDDSIGNQVLLITGHHLLRLPYHYIHPNSNCVNVTASCVDPSNSVAYFLIENKIFKIGKTDSMLHETKLRLSDDFHVSLMTCLDDTGDKLYFIRDGKGLYSLNPLKLIDTFKNSATAIASFNGHVYVGVRDTLFVFDKDNNKEIVSLIAENGDTIHFPFVTTFAIKDDTTLMVGTLNDGIYSGSGKGNKFVRDSLLNAKTNTPRFIRDLSYDGDYIYILTNSQLLVYDPQNPDRTIDATAVGFSRLLPYKNRAVAVINDYGLRTYTQRLNKWNIQEAYQDLSFRPKNCLLLGDSLLLLVRDNGILPVKKNIDNNPQWLPVERNKHLDWSRIFLGLSGAAILALLAALWLYLRKHDITNRRNTALNQQIIDLKSELAESEAKQRATETKHNNQIEDLTRKLVGSEAKQRDTETKHNEQIKELKKDLADSCAKQSATETALKDQIKAEEYKCAQSKELHKLKNELFNLYSKHLSDFHDQDSIKEKIEDTIISDDIDKVKDMVAYVINWFDTREKIEKFKKEFNENKQKLNYMKLEESLQELSILKTIEEIHQRLLKTANANDELRNSIVSFNETPLGSDEIKKVLPSIDDIEKMKSELDNTFDGAKGLLEKQRNKIKKIIDGIRPEYKGWDAFKYLYDEVYHLLIRHRMVKGFVELNKIIKEDISKSAENSIIKKLNNKGFLTKNLEKYRVTCEPVSNTELSEDQQEVKDFFDRIWKTIDYIYEPWIHDVQVDSKLLDILQKEVTKDDKDVYRYFFKGDKVQAQGVIPTLYISHSGFKKKYRDAFMTIVSIKMGKDMVGIYSSYISKSIRNKEELKKYETENPESIATLMKD